MKAGPRRRRKETSTYGLTHAALAVRDPARSLAFYRAVFGMVAVHRSPGFIQAQTPGRRDVLVFQADRRHAGKAGGVAHLGFRVTRPSEVAKAADLVRAAGGAVVEEGEFVPGEPYLFAKDPDGYVVEIWYEKPTTADPGASRRPKPR